HRDEPAQLAATQQIELGRTLIEDFNCIGCHKSDLRFLSGRAAPNLSSVGSRVSANWMFHWLEDPRHFRSSATMPSLLRTEQERADVAAYLAGLSDDRVPAPQRGPLTPTVSPEGGEGDRRAGEGDPGRTGQGETLFISIGCAGCHDTNGVQLAGIGSKYSVSALSAYLVNQ